MSANLLPVDPVLPHLTQALDADAMATAFDALLRPQGARVLGCVVERIKYRPRRNCSLSYRLEVQHDRSGQVFEQPVAARLCTPAEAMARARRASATPQLRSRSGPGIEALPALDMVSWWWPNDSKLLAPRVLADTRRMTEQVLPALVHALAGHRPDSQDATVTVVQYVPEQRVTARVALQARHAAPPRVAYAKASLEPGIEVAHARLRALQATPAWAQGRLRTPAALALQPEHGLHWQAGLPGVAMADLPPRAALQALPALGEQLAALHQAPLPAGSRWGLAAAQARLDEVFAVLALWGPDVEAPLARLRRRLAQGLMRVHSLAPVCLHGDLHPRNVLVEDGQLSLIDLDGIGAGPAVLDLGAWIADSLGRALREGAPPLRDLADWKTLVGAYQEAGGERLRADDLAWSIAWALCTQRAWRAVVNLKPGRWEQVPALLAWAESWSAPQGAERWT